MTHRRTQPSDSERRRTAAEALAAHGTGTTASPIDTLELVHELQVQKVELQQQNEELARVGAELAAALEKYTKLYDFAPVGYLTLSTDGTITRANLTAARLLAVPRGDLVGQRFGLHVGERAAFSAALARTFDGQPEPCCELTLAHDGGAARRSSGAPSGMNMRVELTLSRSTDDESCSAVLVDVTERKRSEEQLQASQKMEALGRMAGGVAHDFNNLLSVILGHAEFALEATELGAPTREDLLGIKTAAERSAALTRRLLAFSRREVASRQSLDMNEVARGLGGMLRVLSGNIELALDLAPDLGRVEADRVQLEQVLMNLALNARDAMPRGGTLTIATSNQELDEVSASRHGVKPGPFVVLTVSDTGIGMDKATMARMFEPFFTTKEHDQGTGFGLSTVYGIVQQCAGDITVRSEEGLGTTFELFFPRADEGVLHSSIPAAPRLARRGTETVLVVEDQPALLQLAKRILVAAGYELLTASSGAEALAICATYVGPIHVSVTDVVMPEMTGPELAEHLRHVRPETKIVFMSGYTNEAFDGMDRQGRLVAFLAKPFTSEALRQIVRETLDVEAVLVT